MIKPLEETVRAIKVVDGNILQTWSDIQKSRPDWTPFDGLPSYRKGKLGIKGIIKAITYVLSSAGWSADRITETLVTLTGNDTMPNGSAMGEEVQHNVVLCESTKWKEGTVKGSREVRKWLKECKGIDIPEPATDCSAA